MSERFRRSPRVLANDMHDTTALYHLGTGRMHLLNASALWIWEHCEACDEVSMARQLCEQFQADEPAVRADVANTLRQFLHEDLIQAVPDAAT